MKKKVVHVISHSHWDREWYMPLEHHKMRLLELIDGNLQLFREDPEFQSFHLDGQTIVLDDYLEIKPQKREEIMQAIGEGKFRVGPYYVLQDEFLTSSEANVRNLQTGIREAKQYGNLTKVGYLPDAFGNAGQMPQIFKQAGMEAIAFGRGVRSVGSHNDGKEKGEYESTYSEMLWESPDGSALLGILFANWYSNGMEIPVDPVKAKEYWDARLAATEQYASSRHLLFMNGCDHEPVQKNLSAALETARKLYPDITFIHSTFEDYVNQLKENTGDKLSVVKGELISQETDGWVTLVNTCSSHVFLKQRNRKNEVALERLAEPLSAWAAVEGKPYPHEQLQYAWKTLMQNHPHDSICGCSIDQVNKEMEIRFDRSTQVAEYVADEAAKYLVAKINTAGFAAAEEIAVPFAVFNTTGWERNQTVTAVLDVARDYQPDLHAGYGCMQALELPAYRVLDVDGNPVDAVIEDVGVSFGYELPDDAFRKPYMARQVKVTMLAEKLPANGYSTYALCPSSQVRNAASMVTGANRMENAYLSVEITANGTLNVTDKRLGRTYQELCSFEDTLDAGNEYMYFCPPGNPAITTKDSVAQIRLVEDTPFMASYEICHGLEIPVSADAQLKEEQRSWVRYSNRRCHRSTETTVLHLCTRVTLEKDARSLQIKTTVDNTARDHRLRVVIPTGLECSHHYAESVFEAAKRPNRHAASWKNPSACEHQQSFVGMHDDAGGILVSNIGLYEYEILPDNAMAVTLLRAVGELGDWGVFPTELSQQLRQITAEYQLSFFSGDLLEAEAYRDAYQFQTPAVVVPTDVHVGKLPLRHSFFRWQGERLAMTNCKGKDNETDRMVRFVNYSGKDSLLTIQKDSGFRELYRSNIIEERKETLHPDAEGYYRIPVGKYEILTLGLKL